MITTVKILNIVKEIVSDSKLILFDGFFVSIFKVNDLVIILVESC